MKRFSGQTTVRDLCVSIAVLFALVWASMPSSAAAATTPPALYECQPRDPDMARPPAPPELPPEVAASLPEAIESDDFQRLCPKGEVPEPTQPASAKAIPPSRELRGDKAVAQGRSREPVLLRRAGQRHRRGGATTSRSSISSFWYSWAGGRQGFTNAQNVNGWFVSQTNEQPYIDYSESLKQAHSLGQLWVVGEGGGCWSSAETGWSESAGQFGDVNPHLFIFAFDCGVGLGYVGSSTIPWVQSSSVAFPNMTLTHNDKFHVYGARMAGNNWWFYYDGQWVGYIPHEAWTKFFPSYVNRGEAGGEVATPNYSTCTDMGYQGRYGWDGGAAMFGEVWYEYNWNTASSHASLSAFASDPNQYVTGLWGGTPLHQFRYGGPGWC